MRREGPQQQPFQPAVLLDDRERPAALGHGPLAEGSLSGATVACPWHGWEYDVKTGACQTDPAITLTSYPVKLEGDDILVSV
ncbi:MAG: nitrite reductase (NAD(P)H) small subunit [Dehalococcoidia bacterium]|nr:nitrite reductase (NAD(P)H) small subunit [Dehalococcoidia bacterium]